ncbi:MAG: hypothetical protein IKO55_08715 [Kiritimatiellae bacterium]|nr:hypothetical protein [Kiritimatiellia bacterium]
MLFERTFHHDEATQAFTTGHLLETGRYTYQPQDHHGPTLYYAAAALQRAAGHNSTASLDGTLLRCTPLLFAVLALVFGFSAIKRLTGRFMPGLVFALLLGTSPFFAFFATDFIQEVILTCFLVMMFWAGAGYLHLGTKWKTGTWALFFGTATALAFATKETCLISFFAAGLAAVPFLVKRVTKDKLHARTRDAVLAILGFLIVSFILYSDFGRDFHGVYNAFIAAPLSYLGRAAGNATTSSVGANWHVHPWWQYLNWLYARTPGLLALFSLASVVALAISRRTSKTTFTAFRFALTYALATFAIYSLIPYKTPWCTVQIEAACVLATVLGLACMADAYPDYKWHLAILPAILLVGGNLPTLVQMNRAPDDTGNPCNYAAASPEVKDLAEAIASALKSPANDEPPVIVALPNADEIGLSSFRWYNRGLETSRKIGYLPGGLENLVYFQTIGFTPTVLIVPENEVHVVQPLFPHLKDKNYFYLRPDIPERQVRGVRVCMLSTAETREGTDNSATNNVDASPEGTALVNTVSNAVEAAVARREVPFIAVGKPAADINPLPQYNKPFENITGYWDSLEDLAQLQAAGFKPTVVIVPMEEGHLVQPLFPHLKNTKRFFYRRPRIPGQRILRVFW